MTCFHEHHLRRVGCWRWPFPWLFTKQSESAMLEGWPVGPENALAASSFRRRLEGTKQIWLQCVHFKLVYTCLYYIVSFVAKQTDGFWDGVRIFAEKVHHTRMTSFEWWASCIARPWEKQFSWLGAQISYLKKLSFVIFYPPTKAWLKTCKTYLNDGAHWSHWLGRLWKLRSGPLLAWRRKRGQKWRKRSDLRNLQKSL